MMEQARMIQEIGARAIPRKFPDGTGYTGIDVAPVQALAERFGVAGRDAEIVALENGIMPERYVRNMRTFSPQDQVRLLKSAVAIVGLGGLGGTVTEILARDGVGHLTLIDGDRFEDSNLNRQLFSACDLLNTAKAEAAARRVGRINPSLTVTAHCEFLSEENAARLLRDADVVVDCLDNLKTRFVLEAAAKQAGVPLVSAAIGGESGHVTTIFPEDAGLATIYGDPDALESKGAEASLGCLPHAITILSALECSEVIKILLKKKRTLRNKLLLMDVADNTFEVLELI